MSATEILELVLLILAILTALVTIISSIVKGDMKNFIIEKMEEAEKIYADEPVDVKAKKKLEYVIMNVKDKYKVLTLILNIKKFIEKIISISKQINYKK